MQVRPMNTCIGLTSSNAALQLCDCPACVAFKGQNLICFESNSFLGERELRK